MLNELLSQWRTHEHVAYPPPQPILLWGDAGRAVGIETRWGPAVPYGPHDRDKL